MKIEKKLTKKNLDLKDPFKKRSYSEETSTKHLKNLLVRTRSTNFDQAILKQADDGNFPLWTKALIEFDADPLNLFDDEKFIAMVGTTQAQIDRVRKKYPGYWTAVKYKQRTFLAELGNKAIKVLAQRMLVSDRALEMALIITGEYTPTMKHQIDEITPEAKRERITQMLEEIKKSAPPQGTVDATVVENVEPRSE